MSYIMKTVLSGGKPGLQWFLSTKAPPRFPAYLLSSSDGGHVLSEVLLAAAGSLYDGLFCQKWHNLDVHFFLRPIHQEVGESFLSQNLQPR